MNGKKAKRIRKKIYGDFSQTEKQYVKHTDGSLRCTDRRREYRKAKKAS